MQIKQRRSIGRFWNRRDQHAGGRTLRTCGRVIWAALRLIQQRLPQGHKKSRASVGLAQFPIPGIALQAEESARLSLLASLPQVLPRRPAGLAIWTTSVQVLLLRLILRRLQDPCCEKPQRAALGQLLARSTRASQDATPVCGDWAHREDIVLGRIIADATCTHQRLALVD